jgi:hypothetical protein
LSYLSNICIQGYNVIDDVDSWLERFELFVQREKLTLIRCTWIFSDMAKKKPIIKDYATLTRFSVIDKYEIPYMNNYL